MQLMRNILIHSFGKSCRKRRLFSVVSTVDTRERMNCKEVVTHGLQEKRRWPEEVIAEQNKLAWEVQSAGFAWLAI